MVASQYTGLQQAGHRDWRGLWQAAAAILTGHQYRADFKRLRTDPQPPEPDRPFSFLSLDMRNAKNQQCLIEEITKPGAEISPQFRKDMANLPASLFAEKYQDILQPMEIAVGTRPVKFDARDFASTVSEFHMPDIGTSSNHVYHKISLGDKIQVIDAYKTSINGTKNASASGTIAALGSKESVKVHLNDMPQAGVETITQGYDGKEATSSHSQWRGNVVEGMQRYLGGLRVGTEANLRDTPYSSNVNGNTAAIVLAHGMGVKLPDDVMSGKVMVDGKPREIPGVRPQDLAKMELQGYAPKISGRVSGEPSFLQLVGQIGHEQHQLYLSQPSASYRAERMVEQASKAPRVLPSARPDAGAQPLPSTKANPLVPKPRAQAADRRHAL